MKGGEGDNKGWRKEKRRRIMRNEEETEKRRARDEQ